MVTGPQVQRLRQALHGVNPVDVDAASREWNHASDILHQVGQFLEGRAGQMAWAIGGETGPAVEQAFLRSAGAMRKKATALTHGATALENASGAIYDAQSTEGGLKDLSPPTPYRAPLGNPTDEELQKQAQSKGHEQQFAAHLADQEEKARIAADALDQQFTHSANTMKQIHGEPDRPVPPPPPPPPPPGGSSTGPNGSTGHTIAVPTPHGAHSGTPMADVAFTHPHGATFDYVPQHHGHDTTTIGGTTAGGTDLPGSAVVSTEGGGSGPGIGAAGATAGGMAAGLIGAKLSGALKGGLFPSSGGAAGTTGRGTAASAVRGIGTSARTGGAGTLGRSGSAAGSGTAGRSGSGTGAGKSGAGATGRSGSGGRAGAGGRSGAGPTGRSGRGKDDEKGKKHELFDVGEDWVDDEGAAPGVLD